MLAAGLAQGGKNRKGRRANPLLAEIKVAVKERATVRLALKAPGG